MCRRCCQLCGVGNLSGHDRFANDVRRCPLALKLSTLLSPSSPRMSVLRNGYAGSTRMSHSKRPRIHLRHPPAPRYPRLSQIRLRCSTGIQTRRHPSLTNLMGTNLRVSFRRPPRLHFYPVHHRWHTRDKLKTIFLTGHLYLSTILLNAIHGMAVVNSTRAILLEICREIAQLTVCHAAP